MRFLQQFPAECRQKDSSSFRIPVIGDLIESHEDSEFACWLPIPQQYLSVMTFNPKNIAIRRILMYSINTECSADMNSVLP